ncbi:hypothetical protein AYL99_00603 [Fonsecaea erecta]|uniref:Polycomb protein VEFS-Box domain-containing protein n=1 Tax=Fonsecaea erecta TaxID=1367422 RepID=A0A178ZZ87_9EURO|nr:hypothetical protein AYL99_00603 [Fonsecaea erecta]OAP64631.1 hypothetical protein AYL99_00603 [Fonsecaea erecta]
MREKNPPSLFRHLDSAAQSSEEMIGDSSSEPFRQKAHQKSFLRRNIVHALEPHREGGEEDASTVDSSSVMSEHTQHIDKTTEGEISAATELGGVVQDAVSNDAEMTGNPSTASSWSELITFNMWSRPYRSENPTRESERTTRQSIRDVLGKPPDSPGPWLTLDVSSIRRRLNMKTNAAINGKLLAKSRKHEPFDCLCRLTIWDSRDGCATLPLVARSSPCRVSVVEDGAHGEYVSLELKDPFVVTNNELLVPILSEEGKSVLGVSHENFVEIRIIPCVADCPWPPFPILPKTVVDRFTPNMRKMGLEEERGAIVASYADTTRAPEPNVPLSVFFVLEGHTYRTQYGLQVESTWTFDPKFAIKQGKGLDMETFYMSKTRETRLLHLPEQAPHGLEVHYIFPAKSSGHAGAVQAIRNPVVRGYGCPICAAWSTRRLQELVSHFKSLHPKCVLSTSKLQYDKETKRLTLVEIKVDISAATRKDQYDEASNKSPLQPLFQCNKPFKLFEPSKTTLRYPLASQVPAFRKAVRKKTKPVRLQSVGDEPEEIWGSSTDRPVSPDEDPKSESDDEVDHSWLIATHMQRLDMAADKLGWSETKCELIKRWDRHRMEERFEHSRYISNSLIRFARKQRRWLREGDDELKRTFFDFLGRLKEHHVIDDNVIADVNELVFYNPAYQHPLPSTEVEKVKIREMAIDRTLNGTPASQQHTSLEVNTPLYDMLNTGRVEGAEPFPQSSDAGHPPSNPPVNADKRRLARAKTKQKSKESGSQGLGKSDCGTCLQPIEHVHSESAYCTLRDCLSPATRYHKKCAVGEYLAGRKRQIPVCRNSYGPIPVEDSVAQWIVDRYQCRTCRFRRWLKRSVGLASKQLRKQLKEEGEEELEEELGEGLEKELDEELEKELEEELKEGLEEIPEEGVEEEADRGQVNELIRGFLQDLESRTKRGEEVPLVREASLRSWGLKLLKARKAEAKWKGKEAASNPVPPSGKGKEVVRDSDDPSTSGTRNRIESTPGAPVGNGPGMPPGDGPHTRSRDRASTPSGDKDESRTSSKQTASVPSRDRPRTRSRGRVSTPSENRAGTPSPSEERAGTPTGDRPRTRSMDKAVTPSEDEAGPPAPGPSRGRAGTPMPVGQRAGTPFADGKGPPGATSRRISSLAMGGLSARSRSAKPKDVGPVRSSRLDTLRGKDSLERRAKETAKTQTIRGENRPAAHVALSAGDARTDSRRGSSRARDT